MEVTRLKTKDEQMIFLMSVKAQLPNAVKRNCGHV